jgi:hypothetical protein
MDMQNSSAVWGVFQYGSWLFKLTSRASMIESAIIILTVLIQICHIMLL